MKWTSAAFIAFAETDGAWVRGFLLPGLGPHHDVHTKDDFVLGAPLLEEAERFVRAADVLVVVLSPAFLTDEWGAYSEILASHSEVRGDDITVVPLLLEPCPLPLRLDAKVGLDCTTVDSWEPGVARLRELLDRPEPIAEPDLACPYPGLAPFEARQHAVFRGREREAELLARNALHQSMLMVIGPSGIGKSSLVFAGLLPRITDDRDTAWTVRTLRLGRQPIAALRAALAVDEHVDLGAATRALLDRQGTDRLLVVVDRFENIFTQASPDDREKFFAAVSELRAQGGSCLVLVTRADFYGELMTSTLWPIEEYQRLDVGPLRRADLTAAIVEPAASVGTYLEPVLVERLLRDCADEPGSLPLLQETLVLLWHRRARRLLTLSAYEELTGGTGTGLAAALRLHADAALAGLSPTRRDVGMRVLVRLVQHGEGRPHTRRRQRESELATSAAHPAEVTAVVDHLAQHRILTLASSPNSRTAARPGGPPCTA